ncbi:hypothetical protein BAUCODRAFT_120043 [Baudoinia panamericana UAMH 10762]|uniref:Uncharacterized protein n=1 Tax=Baudoinia panamericana (strain UAMH 10762) TaxID=717646 RepID=M2NHC3_BAUPA|nr:uncharacterized protein BAUCODRAFT_120043 [Baudoinia panamericana UAMH 10762]EMC98744.1 hypothetical protein BAUCODRAFT_120043 [Baudoinia panamericana UAMH 10762]
MAKARKFTFDLPRLKLGSSKADTKAIQDHLSFQLESPPPTPKSVRPPLSPHVDVELRQACAYVLQNFRPSHIVSEEQYGSHHKQQLDYATIKEASPPALSNGTTKSQGLSLAGGQSASKRKSFSGLQLSSRLDSVRRRDEQGREDAANNATLRAEELMATPSKAMSDIRQRADSHLRSVSGPVRSAMLPPKIDVLERPKTAPRTDSVDTYDSTPQTDGTDYQWSEKASTAMTSAAVTPARSSKRASTQALLSGVGVSTLPTAEASHLDRMRYEIMMHKAAQEERSEHAKREAGGLTRSARADTISSTQLSTQLEIPDTVKVLARKPVPTSRAARQPHQAWPDSRHESKAIAEMRSPSEAGEAAMPDRNQGPFPQRSDSLRRQPLERAASRTRSRGRSITQSMKDFVRPGSSKGIRDAEVSPRPRSRSRSVTRRFIEYVKPGAALSSRKSSLDKGRTSVDSYRSAASHLAPSEDSSHSRWRRRQVSHRKNEDSSTLDDSRPGTSGSTSERGRSNVRLSPSSQKLRPAINLNRELPPLPGLDQWKADETEDSAASYDAQPSKMAVKPMVGVSDETITVLSEQEPSTEELGPATAESGAVLAARMGMPAPALLDTPFAEHIYVLPQPTAAPPRPPTETETPITSANFTSISDFDFEHYTPSDSSPVTPDITSERIRSTSINTPYTPDLSGPTREAESPASVTLGKATLINYSRVAGGPTTGLSRAVSEAGHVAKPIEHTPSLHSRTTSESLNFSRKPSSDGYNRMYDSRHQNIVEIPTSPQTAPPAPRGGRLAKTKWWQKREKKAQNWMDHVVKSGSKSGVLLTDEVAGTPIVRY